MQLAHEGALPEADAAQVEVAHERLAGGRTRRSGGIPGRRTWASAFSSSIIDFLAMVSPNLRPKGMPRSSSRRFDLLVGLRRRHDADLQPAETIDLVVVDLGERDLLAHPRACSCPGRRTTCWGCRGSRGCWAASSSVWLLRELPDALAAEGHLEPDRVARPHAELGDGALGLHHHRLLARDHDQVARRGIDRLGVRQRLAEADVDDDLRRASGPGWGCAYSNCLTSAGTTSFA